MTGSQRFPPPRDLPADESAPLVRRANVLALALCAVGLLQIAGELTRLRALRGVGAALVVAPLPKVFSDLHGLETFASELTFEVDTPDGGRRAVPITPELYHRLGGPYNRRNVYGAALAYAPRLPAPLWEAVFCYGFGPSGSLRRELGLPPAPARVSVRITTKTRGRADTWVLSPSCNA